MTNYELCKMEQLTYMESVNDMLINECVNNIYVFLNNVSVENF